MANQRRLEAWDPQLGSVSLLVPEHILQTLLHYGPAERLWNLLLAQEVLAEPLAIFEGLRDGLQNGRCYLGKPERYFVGNAATEVVGHRPGFYFFVFHQGDGTIYEWRWERCPAHLSPLAWCRDRFTRQLWTNNSLT